MSLYSRTPRVIFCLLFALLILNTQSKSAAATTFTVTNAQDSGPGSLRQAILDANANAVLIQNIKLENEGWERDIDVVEPAELALS